MERVLGAALIQALLLHVFSDFLLVHVSVGAHRPLLWRHLQEEFAGRVVDARGRFALLLRVPWRIPLLGGRRICWLRRIHFLLIIIDYKFGGFPYDD